MKTETVKFMNEEKKKGKNKNSYEKERFMKENERNREESVREKGL